MKTAELEKHFDRIGARVKVGPQKGRWRNADYAIDVKTDRRGEFFDIAVSRPVEFRLLQAVPDQRHLLLLSDDGQRFLCGHDERHWFVAGIEGRVSTVRAAKQSLMPAGVWQQVQRRPSLVPASLGWSPHCVATPDMARQGI